ncbi:MAG: DHHW family protein [Eubacteriales bacterium]
MHKEKLTATIFLSALLLFFLWNVSVNGSKVIAAVSDSIQEMESISDTADFVLATESAINENLLGREELIELYGLTQLILGKQEFNNFSFMKDENNVLYYGSIHNGIDYNMEVYVKRVRRLKEYVEDSGKQFMFVMAPDNYLGNSNEVDEELAINDQNANMDLFLWKANENMIDTVDLRETILNLDFEYEQLYFRTDHHWTPLAAFYAAQTIVEKFEEFYGVQLDPDHYYMDLEQYDMTCIENCVLGSAGDNVGMIYSGGLEDITILTPKFETNYTYQYLNDDGTLTENTGEFDGVLLIRNYLVEGKLDGEKTYLHGIKDSDTIINHNNPDAPTVLVLRDSYFSPVATFLSPMFSEMHMVWINTDDNPGFDTEAYVKEHVDEYDYVIMEVYSHSYDESCFSFFE